MLCLGLQSLVTNFHLALSFSSFIIPCLICLFFLISHYSLFFQCCENRVKRMKGLRVPWAHYTIPLSLALLSMGDSITQTVPFSHPFHPLPLITFHYSAFLVFANGTNTYFHIPVHAPYSANQML